MKQKLIAFSKSFKVFDLLARLLHEKHELWRILMFLPKTEWYDTNPYYWTNYELLCNCSSLLCSCSMLAECHLHKRGRPMITTVPARKWCHAKLRFRHKISKIDIRVLDIISWREWKVDARTHESTESRLFPSWMPPLTVCQSKMKELWGVASYFIFVSEENVITANAAGARREWVL